MQGPLARSTCEHTLHARTTRSYSTRASRTRGLATSGTLHLGITCHRNFISPVYRAGTIFETCHNNMASDYLFIKVFINARPTCILPVVNHGNHERNNCVITIIYVITIRFFCNNVTFCTVITITI